MIKGDNPAERLSRVLYALAAKPDGPALAGWREVLSDLQGGDLESWSVLHQFGLLMELPHKVEIALDQLPEGEAIELWGRYLPQVKVAFEGFWRIETISLAQFRVPLTTEVLYSVEGAAAVVGRTVGDEPLVAERVWHYLAELHDLLQDVAADRDELGEERYVFLRTGIYDLINGLRDYPIRGPRAVQLGADTLLGSTVRHSELVRANNDHPLFRRLGTIAAGLLLALDLGTHVLELLPGNVQAALGHGDHHVTEIHNVNETITVLAVNPEPSPDHPAP
jgi:hypothetical protein